MCVLRVFQNFCIIFVLLLGVSCSGDKHVVGVPVIAAPKDSLARNTPVIDVHAHTFNARFLPIRGIVLGKRDKFLLLTFVSNGLAIRTANYIQSITRLGDTKSSRAKRDAVVAESSRSANPAAVIQDSPQDVVRTLKKIANIADQKNVDGDVPALTDEQIRSLLGDEDARIAARITKTLKRFLGHERGEQLGHSASQFDFLMRIVRSHDLIVDTYHRDFRGKPSLVVSHMMDLGPVYNEKAGETGMIDFVRDQIPRTERQQNKAGSKMIYFVAYNPFRDNGGNDGRAFEIVKTAIKKHGAYGVKIYPPSGYRAAGNAIPGRPFTLFTFEPCKQWCNRYAGVTGAMLDQRLRELLLWCEKEDIPVFAHCHTGEFEARKGYGVKMAHPKWWALYLQQRDQELGGSGRCKLRLCLGHAGGDSFWFDEGEHQDWGKAVWELCCKYPNVYCEVGVHDHIAYSEPRRAFINKLTHLIANPPGATAEYRYKIENKIMYGSDWYMHVRVSHSSYLHAYQTAFLQPGLRRHYRKFFSRNAVAYLDVSDRSRDPKLHPRVRSRLRTFR